MPIASINIHVLLYSTDDIRVLYTWRQWSHPEVVCDFHERKCVARSKAGGRGCGRPGQLCNLRHALTITPETLMPTTLLTQKILTCSTSDRSRHGVSITSQKLEGEREYKRGDRSFWWPSVVRV